MISKQPVGKNHSAPMATNCACGPEPLFSKVECTK